MRARIVDPQGLLREHLEPSIHLEVPRLAPGRGTWTFENSPSVDENGFLVAWFTYDEGDLRGRALDVELLVAPRSMYSWEWASPLLLEPAFHARARFTGVPEIDEPGLAVVDLGEVAPRALPVAATFEIRSDRDEVCEVGFSRFTEMVVNGVSMPDRVEIRTNETHELFGWLDSPTERWHLWGSARDEPGRVVFAPWFGPGDHVVATLAEPISLTVDSTGIFDIDDGWAVLTPRAEHVPAVPLPEGSRPSSRLFAILQRENWSRPSLNTYGFQVSRRDPVRFEGLPPGDYVLDLWLEAQAVVGPLLSVDVTLPLPGGGEVLEL
ncbi:MAG: hypothetical protein R3F34_07435 [Planctomycetota bacterium]